MGCGGSSQKPAAEGDGKRDPPAKPTNPGKVPKDILFTEFPTPDLLRLANQKYAALGHPLPKNDDGKLEPYPCPSSRKTVYTPNPELDRHCSQVPKELYIQPTEQMIAYFTQVAKTDVEKVRAIYAWLSSNHDVSGLQLNEALPEDCPLRYLVLLAKKSVYNQIFCLLCLHMGIQHELVEGIAKSAAYDTGDPVTKCTRNTWVAVVVNDTWRLVDMLWGASCVSTSNTGEWMLLDDDGQAGDRKQVSGAPVIDITRRENYYFLTEPEQFVCRHLPDDPKWQLLARPITRQEFEDMADIEQDFFYFDIKLHEQRRCVLRSKEGEVDIVLGLNEKKPMTFSYKLWMSAEDEQAAAELNNVQMDRFAFFTQRDGELHAQVTLPVVGKYKLDLSGIRCNWDDDREEEEGGHGGKMPLLGYVIHCDKAKANCVPLPKNERQEWGPGPALDQAGLQPVTHKEAVIEAEKGEVEAHFTAEPDVMVQVSLEGDNITDENYVVHKREGNEVIVNAKVPEAGKYALNMFTKHVYETNYTNVCTYLIQANSAPADVLPFPNTVEKGQIGEQESGILTLTSHPTPVIETSEKELQIIFKMLKVKWLEHVLTYLDDNRRKNVSNMAMGVRRDDQYVSNVRLQKKGMYMLELFTQDNRRCVYRCIINSKASHADCLPYPKAYPAWGDGKLLKPDSGVLPQNELVAFALTAPGAYDVTLVSGNKQVAMKVGKDGIWRGEIQTGGPGSDVTVTGRVKENNKWITQPLLQFLVEGEEETEVEITTITEENGKQIRKASKEKRNQLQRDLILATKERNSHKIRKLLKEIEEYGLTQALSPEVSDAKLVLESLSREWKLKKKCMMELDAATISEIRRYRKPPSGIHDTMVASLLLLGNHEGDTREWQRCQALCQGIGKSSLKRRVRDYQLNSTHPEIASRAKDILEEWDSEDIHVKSEGAAAFHNWSTGMVDEVHRMKDDASDAPSADLQRQRQLLPSVDYKNTMRI